MKKYLADAILSEVPDEGIHFRALLRRLQKRGILSSDKTLKRYLDHLVAKGLLIVRESRSGPGFIPRKLYARREGIITSQRIQVEAETLARAAAALIRAHFPVEIEKVVPFGSVARGEVREGSDIDLLVIARPGVDWYGLTRQLYELIEPMVASVGLPISLHVYEKNEARRLLRLGSPFLKEAMGERRRSSRLSRPT